MVRSSTLRTARYVAIRQTRSDSYTAVQAPSLTLLWTIVVPQVAALRSPDGVMIGLYEPNSWENVTSA